MESNDLKNWADNAWEKIEKQGENERAKNRANGVLAAQGEQIKRDTPSVWSDAREKMKAMCDAFNERGKSAQLHWDSERGYEAIIRIEPSSRTFRAIFDRESLRIRLEGKNLSETYSPVLQNGAVLFSSAGEDFMADELAIHFLDQIVRSISPA
jgi:hypothetical protein